jgi:hypothetical protein
MQNDIPRCDQVVGIKCLNVARCNCEIRMVSDYVSEQNGPHISTTHFVMVCGLQLEDAERVEEQRKSFPNSHPRTVGLSAYRLTT